MKKILAFLFLVVILAAAAGGFYLKSQRDRLEQPFQRFEAPLVLDILPGSGSSQILRTLESQGVIENAQWTRLFLIHVLGDPPLQAGEYRFESPATALEVIDRLNRGDVLEHPFTLVEGQTLEETATTLSLAGLGTEARFLNLLRDPHLINTLDPEADSLEGYLFPDSYQFPKGTPEEAIVTRLVSTFQSRLDRAVAETKVPGPIKVREIVTLASIVEAEAQLDKERPLIAAVYRNRLDRGIALYADPTIIYALKRLGRWDGNIRRPDLKLDSPWNTYLYPGLPPSPIGSPGYESLKAALAPADAPYLYFVSRNDGSHVFSKTLAEHNRQVYRWQKLYWRERWAEERQTANN